MSDQKETKQVWFRLSLELHRKLKMWAASRDMSMQEAGVLAVEKFLKEQDGGAAGDSNSES